MNPLRRAVCQVFRLIAAGLVLIGGLNVGLEFIRHHFRQTEINVARCLLWSIPVVLGVILFAASARLARRLTDDSDEDPP